MARGIRRNIALRTKQTVEAIIDLSTLSRGQLFELCDTWGIKKRGTNEHLAEQIELARGK